MPNMEEQERRTMDAVMARLLGPIPSHQCSAKNAEGGPCGMAPEPGATVCRKHGGSAPRISAAAQQRTATRQAVLDAKRSILDLTDDELIAQYGDPAQTLQWIIAISRALASRMQAALADKEELTYYDAFGNIHVRGEVGALLKAADLAGSHAERALRLGLDKRGLDLQEQQLALLDRALDTALTQAGLNTEMQRTVRRVLRSEILAADSAGSE
jgi:hypothetical protein